jgi:hypothetical protein
MSAPPTARVDDYAGPVDAGNSKIAEWERQIVQAEVDGVTS